MEALQQVAEDCNFVDLGFNGLPYTWDNRQEGERNVKVRLDRAFGDHKFMEVLLDTSVRHAPMAGSDHCALVVEVKKHRPINRRRRQRRKRVFRYENMRQRHDAYMEFVEQVWDPGPPGSNLASVAVSLSSLQSSFTEWNKNVFGSVKKKIERPKKELENVRSDTLYTRPTAREELMVQLLETLAREEIMERQRSRVKWLREGDRNTSFFQAKARARSRGNKIRGLKMKLET